MVLFHPNTFGMFENVSQSFGGAFVLLIVFSQHLMTTAMGTFLSLNDFIRVGPVLVPEGAVPMCRAALGQQIVPSGCSEGTNNRADFNVLFNLIVFHSKSGVLIFSVWFDFEIASKWLAYCNGSFFQVRFNVSPTLISVFFGMKKSLFHSIEFFHRTIGNEQACFCCFYRLILWFFHQHSFHCHGSFQGVAQAYSGTRGTKCSSSFGQ